ncbi:MAG: sulfur carrier protein ThiS [Phycisphaerales bacterium]|nr:sulfur carrier protein ThiS [Phycisphaerales bacterium]
MTCIINGTAEELSSAMTVAELLAKHNLSQQPCAVKVNEKMIPRRSHATHVLSDGDRVELVTLVGGG